MHSFLKVFYKIIIPIIAVIGFQSCSKSTESPNIPTSPVEKSDTYTDCIVVGTDNTLEVATWNIEHFPKRSTTPLEVHSIISHSEYDLWSVQEIEQIGALKSISTLDRRYSVLVDSDIHSGVNRNYHLAFVYRNDKLKLLDKKVLPFASSPFPRRPLLAKFKWNKDGKVFYVINLHLKCCSGPSNESRRREASRVLKEYIDNNLPDDIVFVIGDFNDVIYPYNKSEFQNILDNPTNFKFADMKLAKSDNQEEDFSYPNPKYLSHIDHILISNETFSIFKDAKTLTLDNCSSFYDYGISDHRPIVAFFN